MGHNTVWGSWRWRHRAAWELLIVLGMVVPAVYLPIKTSHVLFRLRDRNHFYRSFLKYLCRNLFQHRKKSVAVCRPQVWVADTSIKIMFNLIARLDGFRWGQCGSFCFIRVGPH